MGVFGFNELYKFQKAREKITMKKQLIQAVKWYILNYDESVSIEDLLIKLPEHFKFPGKLQLSRQLLTYIINDSSEFFQDGRKKNKYGHLVNTYNIKLK